MPTYTARQQEVLSFIRSTLEERGIAPTLTRANLGAMLRKLKERELPVLLAGMYAPPNMGTEYVQAFNAMYPDRPRSSTWLCTRSSSTASPPNPS